MKTTALTRLVLALPCFLLFSGCGTRPPNMSAREHGAVEDRGGGLAIVVELYRSGRTLVDGKEVHGDDDLLRLAREGHRSVPDADGLIIADPSLPADRVRRVVALLQQAEIAAGETLWLPDEEPFAPPTHSPSLQEPQLHRVARPPFPKGSRVWKCRVPRTAQLLLQERSVEVILSVMVDASGQVQRVRLLHDPGSGLARAAAACAKKQPFRPAANEDGQPVAAASAPIAVRYVR